MDWNIDTVAHVIEIAVAPVFLLAGISGLLMVLTNRLGRAIDRSRSLQGTESDFLPDHQKAAIESEFKTLTRRGRLIHLAISLSTASALLVCLVIITLFVGSLAQFNVSIAVATLFIVALSLLSFAFLCFLTEIFISIRTLKLKE